MRERRTVRGLHRGGNTLEEEDAEDGDLCQSLTDDELPHLVGDEAFTLGDGLALEELVTGGLGGEGQRGEGVHDEVDPQHLDGIEGGLAEDGATHEGHNQGHEVDGQLELKELPDGVEDVSAPLHGGHNRAEVVVEQDDA